MYECIIQTRGIGILWVTVHRLNTLHIFTETRSITSGRLVDLRYSTQITDNGIGKRHLVSLRLKLSKNAF
jgi:hypothetical protein